MAVEIMNNMLMVDEASQQHGRPRSFTQFYEMIRQRVREKHDIILRIVGTSSNGMRNGGFHCFIKEDGIIRDKLGNPMYDEYE